VKDGPARGTIKPARRSRRGLQLATLPDGPVLSLTEAESLVADFRRARDAQRGRYAADARDLPAPGGQIATAIVQKSLDSTNRTELRRLAEDLVDLQAFVELDGAPAPLPPANGQSPSPVLELIHERQAAAIHYLRQDPSVAGDKAAQRGRLTPIGQARSALDRTLEYREDQASGLLAVMTFVIAGTAGAIVARLFVVDQFTLAALVLLFVAWFTMGWIGAQILRAETSVLMAIERRWRAVPDSIAFLSFLAVVIVLEFVVGLLIVVVTARLSLPQELARACAPTRGRQDRIR